MGMWKKSSPELIALFDVTMSTFPEVERRKMFGYPCCFVNGNMLTGLHQEDWVVRLPEEERETLVSTHGAKPFEPMPGKKMREYVILPKAIVSNERERLTWVEKSLAFVGALPPK